MSAVIGVEGVSCRRCTGPRVSAHLLSQNAGADDVDGADADAGGADVDGADADPADVDGADADSGDADGADADGADVEDFRSAFRPAGPSTAGNRPKFRELKNRSKSRRQFQSVDGKRMGN